MYLEKKNIYIYLYLNESASIIICENNFQLEPEAILLCVVNEDGRIIAADIPGQKPGHDAGRGEPGR